MSVSKEILSQYNLNLSKPKYSYSNLSIYDATSKQTSIPYTIKIVREPDFKLEQYIKAIKTISSDYVIKIYEFVYDAVESRMVIVQENCQYGTLKKALTKCKRLEDEDSVAISKMLLNGHIDLLRMGINWFGDENDIQFTENGLKLSWNNSSNFTTASPFREILTRIGIRTNQSSILPFPKNKPLNDLIAVSKENASEISLHPLLKKKEKILKKKGRGWLGIKEYKLKGEYFQELTYFAVSEQFGFVRVKVMDAGQVDESLLKIHQTKASFVKILDYYEQNKSFYFVSEYANDGTLQNYVKRLKANNMVLKENQIEFFFVSMIQPLKFIHETEVKSLNMLHIKNIYIENGIPKIGEPVILTPAIKQSLAERAEVPDFYYNEFKLNPSQKDPRNDTYSLGVLLYKLMYTEYPIFPERHVHIPSAPNYKKNLKFAIELFLNEGGKLSELEQRLEISDDVKFEVKNNEKILQQVTNKNKEAIAPVEEVHKAEDSELEFHEERNKQHEHANIFVRFWRWLTKRGKDHKGKYAHLYKSQLDGYRKCTTIFIILSLYFFAFFFFFMEGAINLFSFTPLFTPYPVNILGINHYVITPSFYKFTNEYEAVKTGEIYVLNQTMNCLIDDNLAVYDYIRPESPHWYIYLGLGIITMIIFLVLKGIQIYTYSTARAGYHHYDTTLEGSNQSRFAISSFVYFHLWQGMSLYCFYYLFNIIYNEQHLPCFGKRSWTNLTTLLMQDREQFALNFMIIICICFLLNILSFAHLKKYQRIRYSMIVNPIFIFTVPYLVLFIMMRVGAFDVFMPSFLSNEQGIIGNSYMNIVGYFPQTLIIVEICLCLLIDQIYYKLLGHKIQSFILEQTHSQELKLEK